MCAEALIKLFRDLVNNIGKQMLLVYLFKSKNIYCVNKRIHLFIGYRLGLKVLCTFFALSKVRKSLHLLPVFNKKIYYFCLLLL